MNRLFIQLLTVTSILFIAISGIAADGTPAVKKSPSKTPAKTEALTKDEENKTTNAIAIAVLNQIIMAKLDFNLDVNFKTTGEGEESRTAIDFKYLDISAIVKFKDQILHSFVTEKTNSQLKKIVPALKFSSKEMLVVSKATTDSKGNIKVTVRFCQNYSINNDFCNTLNDQKLLDVSVSSTNFEMFDMRFKDITVLIDQKKLVDGKFAFSGSCTAWKSAFDVTTPDKTIMKPALCEFSGLYDSKATVKFDGNLKLKSK